jgi:hypothetical protein
MHGGFLGSGKAIKITGEKRVEVGKVTEQIHQQTKLITE